MKNHTQNGLQSGLKIPELLDTTLGCHMFLSKRIKEKPNIAKRNVTEIASITHYLFEGKEVKNSKNPSKYLGDPSNGEKLFSAVGCMGCHVKEQDPSLAPQTTTFKESSLSKKGSTPASIFFNPVFKILSCTE